MESSRIGFSILFNLPLSNLFINTLLKHSNKIKYCNTGLFKVAENACLFCLILSCLNVFANVNKLEKCKLRKILNQIWLLLIVVL